MRNLAQHSGDEEELIAHLGELRVRGGLGAHGGRVEHWEGGARSGDPGVEGDGRRSLRFVHEVREERDAPESRRETPRGRVDDRSRSVRTSYPRTTPRAFEEEMHAVLSRPDAARPFKETYAPIPAPRTMLLAPDRRVRPAHDRGPRISPIESRDEHYPDPPRYFPSDVDRSRHYGVPVVSEVNSAQFLAKLELAKDPTYLFDGDRDKYANWAINLLRKMNLAGLDGADRLQVLQNHTTRKAKVVVDTFANVIILSPTHAEENFREAWKALEERFGSRGHQVDNLRRKVANFAAITSEQDWFEIGRLKDVCKMLSSAMRSCDRSEAGLEKYNRREGLLELAMKLPTELRRDWHSYGHYARSMGDSRIGIQTFISFLELEYDKLRDDYFRGLDYSHDTKSHGAAKSITDSKSSTSRTAPCTRSYHADAGSSVSAPKSATVPRCALDETHEHYTGDCPNFQDMTYQERKDFLGKKGLCYICTGHHLAFKCNVRIKCDVCKRRHHTSLHRYPADTEGSVTSSSSEATGLEGSSVETRSDSTKYVACTPTRERPSAKPDEEKSCKFSMSFVVEVGHDDREEVIECIAMLDCHSWRTFCAKELADGLRLPTPHIEYDIGTLASFSTFVQGHSVEGLKIRNPDGGEWVRLPTVYTNEFIPEVRAKRASREIIERIEHLAHLAPHFQKENRKARTLLLLGEDVQDLFQITSHGKEAPFAQETTLGWALIGSVAKEILPERCLAREAQSSKTVCYAAEASHESFTMTPKFLPRHEQWDGSASVFEIRPDDEETAWSRESDEFIKIMKEGFTCVKEGAIQLPLPFRKDYILPRNEIPVYYRTQTVLQRIEKDPVKLALSKEAMQKYLDRGHVERVPVEAISSSIDCCWLPIFSVMHPRKPSVRLVFDASAKFRGTSLNDALFSGPDLNNSLRGVLLRFRTYAVAFSLDIEHMFNCFRVPESHRDYLRFFWWADNDPSGPIVQYRSLVHLFGACSSPAVAMFALKAIAAMGREKGELSESEAVFIENCFYIDDGMNSCIVADEAVSLIARVTPFLHKFGLKIHKIRSNSRGVTTTFGGVVGDSVVFDTDQLPRALGVTWDTDRDFLHVLLELPDRPFTRRGLLATSNTAFDPLGIAAPVLLGARLLQRKILSNFPPKSKIEWDEPLPESFIDEWKVWIQGTTSRTSLSIQRCLLPQEPNSVKREIHVFADASAEAIGCVAYVRSVDAAGKVVVRFLMGNSKVAPRAATTIPRLELCAVLIAALAAYESLKELGDIRLDGVFFYTDSAVVLGYLRNQTRCFSKYVTRRVEAIHRLTGGKDWNFVATEKNPADIATRPHTAEQLLETCWLSGPDFLWKHPLELDQETPPPSTLPETIVPDIHVSSVCSSRPSWLVELAQRKSKWTEIVTVARIIIGGTRSWLDKARQRLGVSLAPRSSQVAFHTAELELFQSSQRRSFPEIFRPDGRPSVELNKKLPDRHPLQGLTPFIEEGQVLRVGGRLRNCISPFEEKHPIILSGKCPIARRFAEHVHAGTPHQGRMITLDRIRRSGVFILGGKRLVGKIVTSCVTCRRLRAPSSSQVMADLPKERTTECDMFDHIGVDVFGPYYVHDGRSTRRTVGSKKVFVLLVNCMASRAIHLEPLESMDTSAMMNALRRFFSLRGMCKSITSDHGGNFLGVLGQSKHFSTFKKEVESRGILWYLNPVGASHYGGAYERKIGSVRRVLEAYLLNEKTPLSRDELHTYLQEAAAVVNSTPLYVSYDHAEEPIPISPQMLLTLKAPSAFCPGPEEIVKEDEFAYGVKRWRRVQRLADAFWDQWRSYYLQDLATRRKWTKIKSDMWDGDVVLLREKYLPRCEWRMAVVHGVTPGSDSRVRRVTLRLLDGRGKLTLTERAIHDLVLLHSPRLTGASGGV